MKIPPLLLAIAPQGIPARKSNNGIGPIMSLRKRKEACLVVESNVGEYGVCTISYSTK